MVEAKSLKLKLNLRRWLDENPSCKTCFLSELKELVSPES